LELSDPLRLIGKLQLSGADGVSLLSPPVGSDVLSSDRSDRFEFLIFTLFLSHGARCNATVHHFSRKTNNKPTVLIEGTIAWADFLFICFDFPSSIGQESQYLVALDSFLSVAHFSEIGKKLDDQYPGYWNFANCTDTGGIHYKFFTHLGATSLQSSCGMNERLLVQVTDRVLSKVDQTCSPMEPAWDIIGQVFSETTVKMLKNKYDGEYQPTS
jgi:hypothetical protein